MQDNNNGVYLMLTSNDVRQLPPEFTRAGRLDAKWFFDLPNAESRRSIIDIHFKRYKRILDEDTMDLAVEVTKDFTGAEIEELAKACMRKAFIRFKEDGNADITAQDIQEAAEEITPIYKSSREIINALRQYCKGRFLFTEKADEEEASSGFRNPLYSDNFAI